METRKTMSSDLAATIAEECRKFINAKLKVHELAMLGSMENSLQDIVYAALIAGAVQR